MIAELLRLLAVAAIPLVVGSIAVAVRGPGEALRQKMKADAEIVALLPATSKAHRTMLEILDEQSDRLRQNQHLQRDLSGTLAGCLLYLVFALLAINLWGHADWWVGAFAILSGVLAIFSLVLLLDGLMLRQRSPERSSNR